MMFAEMAAANLYPPQYSQNANTVWRDQGLLIPLASRGKKNMAYTKPTQSQAPVDLLSEGEDNKI